jgi:hypothetical protein
MKTFVFTIFTVTLLTADLCLAQSFIDTTKIWSIVITDSGGGPSHGSKTTSYFKFTGDTTIKAKDYFVLYECNDVKRKIWRINSYWREKNDSVFQYNTNTGNEDLMYDFILTENDTFLVNEQITLYVDSVRMKEWGEKLRKHWYLSSSGFEQCGTTVWIEGVGNIDLFLLSTNCNLVGAITSLLCFTENNKLVYQNPEYNDCYINSSVSAQNISITDSVNRWNIGLNCVSYEPIDPYNKWSTYFVHIEGDTLFNNKHYKKLFNCADSTCINKSFKSFIREDSSKVFLANKTRELLLYDFNLKQGDSLVMYFLWDDMDSNPYFIQVDSVKTAIFQDQKERLMQFVSVYDYRKRGRSINDVLVEGIGSLRFGLEYPGNLFITGANGCYTNLLCFYTDKNLVYNNPEFNDCYITTEINQVQLKPELVNVFSAQNGILVVELTISVPGTIFVFNTLGELVSQEKVFDSTSQFSMHATGVYLYRFVSDDGRVQTGKVFIK